ncbi:MAG: glycosyltransferase family 2 protein, partial [Calditrichia bacterium]|nr:glycosyltransferase family 2 protein [Calditrichia bacterium]
FISYKKNQGKAEAVRIGVLKALQDNPDYVGYWDADLATPLNAINSFANEFHKNKNLLFILGARTKLLGRKIIRKHYRHYLGRIFATVISCTFSLPIYDTQCGAKIFRVVPELDKIFNKKFKAKWIFDVEIILRFREIFTNSNLHLEKVAHEYPLTNWNEIYGSKITLLDYFKSMFDFLKLFISYSKKREKQ